MNLDLSCSILLFLSTLSFSLQVLSFTCWKLMIQNLCKLKMKSICKQTGCLATKNDINNDSLGDFNLVLYGWENSGRPDERWARVSVYVIKIVCCFMIETVIRPPPPHKLSTWIPSFFLFSTQQTKAGVKNILFQ